MRILGSKQKGLITLVDKLFFYTYNFKTMKYLVNCSGADIFRNKKAIATFNEMSNRTYIIESGKDSHGNIYFHWANGNTDRYTRKEFLNLDKNQYNGNN